MTILIEVTCRSYDFGEAMDAASEGNRPEDCDESMESFSFDTVEEAAAFLKGQCVEYSDSFLRSDDEWISAVKAACQDNSWFSTTTEDIFSVNDYTYNLFDE